MQKLFLYILFIATLFIPGPFPVEAEAAGSSSLAKVKVELLPVYTDTSVTSGIVKFIRKGEVVRVKMEIMGPEARWCNLVDSDQTTSLGFVICEALEYSEQKSPDQQEKKQSSPSPSIKETQPSPRPTPPPPSKVAQIPPQVGEFLQALWKGDRAKVKELLERGADPNLPTTYGTTPLLIASKMKDPELIKILIEHDADVEGRDSSGMTPLMAAVSVGYSPNVQVLIKAGADINGKDKKGFTPLMWAASKGSPSMVRLLLAHGAEVNARTNEGLTALRLSKRIIAEVKRSLADDQKTSKKEVLSGLQKDLARHEAVSRLLEEASGKKPD